MKILKLIASVVLLNVLAVSTASAANVPINHAGGTYDMYANDTYHAFDPLGYIVVILPPGTTTFTHTYDFDVKELLGLMATTTVNLSSGASWIANLTFQWDSNPAVAVSDASGTDLTTVFSQFLTAGFHTLTVTGLVSGDTTIDTAYDFSIKTVVPVPAAFWLFGSALVAFIGFGRRSTA